MEWLYSAISCLMFYENYWVKVLHPVAGSNVTKINDRRTEEVEESDIECLFSRSRTRKCCRVGRRIFPWWRLRRRSPPAQCGQTRSRNIRETNRKCKRKFVTFVEPVFDVSWHTICFWCPQKQPGEFGIDVECWWSASHKCCCVSWSLQNDA